MSSMKCELELFQSLKDESSNFMKSVPFLCLSYPGAKEYLSEKSLVRHAHEQAELKSIRRTRSISMSVIGKMFPSFGSRRRWGYVYTTVKVFGLKMYSDSQKNLYSDSLTVHIGKKNIWINCMFALKQKVLSCLSMDIKSSKIWLEITPDNRKISFHFSLL